MQIIHYHKTGDSPPRVFGCQTQFVYISQQSVIISLWCCMGYLCRINGTYLLQEFPHSPVDFYYVSQITERYLRHKFLWLLLLLNTLQSG
jgi:hypothetical protein